MKRKSLSVCVSIILIIGVYFLTGCEKKENKVNNTSNTNTIVLNQANNTNQNTTQQGQDNIEQINIVASIGNVAKIENTKYYWKLDEQSRESTALYAKYTPTRNYKSKLIKQSPDGKETVIMEDTGEGKICVTTDRIYYESTAGNTNKVCSVDLEGKNKKEHVEGNIKYLVGNYLYIQGTNKIEAINLANGESTTIRNEGNLVGVAENNVYYTVSNYKEGSLGIGIIQNSKDKGNVTTISKNEYKDTSYNPNVTFVRFRYFNNKVKIDVADVQGTGMFIQQGFVVEMDADGKNVTKTQMSDADENSDESGIESIIGLTDSIVEWKNNALLYTLPGTNQTEKIMNDDEITNKFGFNIKDDEHTMSVYSADLVGDELYITLDNGIHNSSEDIGWRYAYKRIKTVVFSYNTKTKELKTMYQF